MNGIKFFLHLSKCILQPCTIKLNVTIYRFIIIDNSFLKQTYIPAKLTSIRQSYI